MTDYGLVSIITPLYNSAEFIAETIDSVLSQTYTNWELLITDDCSSDDSCEIVRRYAANDNRIKLFCLEQNSGAGAARNRSIAEARGRFIAFLDSDDRWLPEKLERQLAFMQERKATFVCSSYYVCTEEGGIRKIVRSHSKSSYFQMVCDDRVGCLTAVYDTRTLGKFYMPLLRKRQDWGLWLKIIQKSKIVYGLSEPLAIYRLRTGSVSCNKWKLIRYNIAVYQEILGYSFLRSWLVFLFLFMPIYIWKKLVRDRGGL